VCGREVCRGKVGAWCVYGEGGGVREGSECFKCAIASEEASCIVHGSTKGFVSLRKFHTHISFPSPQLIRLVFSYHSPLSLSLPLPSRCFPSSSLSCSP
jgi:hypothetical protein